MQQPRRRVQKVEIAAAGTALQSDTAAATVRRETHKCECLLHTKSRDASFLLAASVLQAASAEQYSRTEDKLASPPDVVGRVERRRRRCPEVVDTQIVLQIAACKNTTSSGAKGEKQSENTKLVKAARRGQPCRRPGSMT